jgi:iron complex outermembrane receptor protein
MTPYRLLKTLSVISVAVLSTCGATAFADTPVMREAAAEEGELAEVIVTAQKREEDLQKTPIAISAFSGPALEDQGIGNLTELPQLVPNFLSVAGGIGIASSASYAIRGIGQTGYTPASEAGVGTYVDGVYVARITGGALDLADIERVEVLRGPQGTLFGRNTVGGAVNIITMKPNLMGFDGKVDLSAGLYTGGSEPMGSARASFNVPLSDSVAMRITALGRHSDGWGENNAPLRHGEHLGAEDVVSGKATLLYQPSETFDLTLSADKFQRRGTAAPPIQIAGPLALPEEPLRASLDAASTDDINVWGASITANWTPGVVKLKSISAYRAQDGVTAGDADGSVAPSISAYSLYKQDQISQEFQLSGDQFGDRIYWLLGAYFFTENGHFLQFANSYGVPFAFDVDNKTISYAAFSQATAKLTQRLRLTLGMRYTTETKEIDAMTTGAGQVLLPQSHAQKGAHATTPKVGLDFQISDQVLTYVSYTRGFRSGGFVALPTSPAALATPFEPETNSSYEIGLKSELFERRVRLNVAAFYSAYNDIQVNALTFINGVIIPVVANAAKADLKGLEFDGQWQASRGLSLFGSLGLLDNDGLESKPGFTVATGGTLPQSSRVNSALGFDYQVPGSPHGLSFGADWSHRSSYYFDIANSKDSIGNAYDLFNARVKMQPEGARWSMALSGKNLGDKRYRLAGLSAPGIAVVAVAPTRSVGLDFDYRF